jgi:hypothetical protein
LVILNDLLLGGWLEELVDLNNGSMILSLKGPLELSVCGPGKDSGELKWRSSWKMIASHRKRYFAPYRMLKDVKIIRIR